MKCPFCCSEKLEVIEGSGAVWVQCHSCMASGPHGTGIDSAKEKFVCKRVKELERVLREGAGLVQELRAAEAELQNNVEREIAALTARVALLERIGNGNAFVMEMEALIAKGYNDSRMYEVLKTGADQWRAAVPKVRP